MSQVPSIQVLTDADSHFTMNTEFHIPFELFMQMYIQNLDERDLWHT